MKKRIALTIILGLSVFIWGGSVSSGEQNGAGTSFMDALPEVEKETLANGVKILYVRNELPVTQIYASISYGKLHENRNNAGISELLARVLSISGSQSYPGNVLNQKLESIGGEINITAGWESVIIEIRVLSRNSALAFEILGDVLKNPVIDESGVVPAKKLITERILRSMDEPDEVGAEKLREIIFNGTGYGSVPTPETISGIKASDIMSLWKRITAGGNISIAVSSSLDGGEIFSLGKDHFSGLNAGSESGYTVDTGAVNRSLKSSEGIIYLIPMELEQATIYIGTYAPEINYSGNYALYLMNYILGGGSFNSRLMNEIRVRRGLAYSVFSVVRNRKNAGVFLSFVQTRNESVPQVLSIMNENIRKISSEPVSTGELSWAKESVINSYIFRFNSVEDLLGNYLDADYNGLESGYFRDYPVNIGKVTPADIVTEGGRMFGRGIVTVVVGNRSLEKALSSMGKVVICEEAGK